MSVLLVKNMNHGFGDRAIFEDVSFRLLKGEHVGLIGANGEGKSTFMNIVTDKLMPDEGKVVWSNNVRVGYMDQHAALVKGQSVRDALRDAFKYLFDLEAEMNSLYEKMGEVTEEELNKMLERTATIQDLLDHNGFYVIDPKVEEIAKGLGLSGVGLDKDVDDLSGGQRTKILLGKLLLQKPDILLLDEPTNYLDEEHIEWLKRYLQSYENAFILISHDIPFLNEVVNLVYHVEERKLTRYVGDHTEFMRLYEDNKKRHEQAFEKQQKEIARLEDFVARNKANVATSNMAKSRQKKLDKMDVLELSKDKPKPEFRFKQARTAGKVIFETKDLVIGYDSPLTKPLNLAMERGQKIALVGANGLGKSTLLKSLLGKVKPLSGEVELGDYQHIGYFEQEDKSGNTNSCMEEIWQEFPGKTQYEIRASLAKCGLTTKQIESKIMVLSGGEAAKVRLCKILNNETNILIFDEPTNHLDVDAKEELKQALIAYKGTILLVSHEPEFYRDIITETWNCEDWTTKIV
ncbi:ABC-F family ATP-binding cassette domain-containing protein [Clostridium gasigenes]|uniref:ABC-F family ATP-binding cassette domain-containing protein n=1 Tax=Clostridium gasigenes TaxID=94869 RepID=UPI0014385081|nr:ABC-F family ATP-binding cassette domain-containing protein [Clostridium gasigenes]MBB6624388.1 ABC-F family ATP-binding cassette domain-containing protein [Clostridium gasigenes]MBU3109143.1 ATP-binding cassette domain-containing protein [Clostridium gasigenes]NKF06848.1 ABC-F family ATP-binding cassette domain-containing protein [Clostridium gasigenes]QSW19883.1 ABC-F family ATP-binding cassette domain-containing protein [Clostridium gasigenes]